jgi:hypothetical protein
MVTGYARLVQPIFRPSLAPASAFWLRAAGAAGGIARGWRCGRVGAPRGLALRACRSLARAAPQACESPGQKLREGSRREACGRPREGLREGRARAFRNPALTCGNSTLRHFLYRFVAKLESPAIASSSAR